MATLRWTPALDQRVAVATARPRVAGKFLAAGDEKLLVRGVTYGTFAPGSRGDQFPEPTVAAADLTQMAARGINAVRTYTAPPIWLLDLAQRQGIRVMVGLPTELGNRHLLRRTAAQVHEWVMGCAGHPTVLCYVIGNEFPTQLVRWYGRHWTERYLLRLYQAAKGADPDGLVTYVNYPSTEYLDLSFLDFLSFNVYLEDRDRLERYLARLHNLAGERPLVLAEFGLDSRRHGEHVQADVLDWQVRSAFAGGAAGAFVYAWTDEWYRGGSEILDWDFGLTDRARQPKPALAAVAAAYREVPFPMDGPWPRVSVVVCSHNGHRTIAGTLQGLTRLRYPDYEVIVVDDGSTTAVSTIASEYDVRLIRTENRGLSAARNAGLAVASGDLVAYIDDDARPDPDWLTYVAATFLRTDHTAVGGPNIAPPDDGFIADCVARAPGGPIHVLLSDEVAEHVPGCNLTVRTECLKEIGGFDPRFRAAGDDVDLCWRLHQRGWTVGVSPAAMVWHHRRKSIRAYWRQQIGYGRAEALLEEKWPERYNAAGHLSWMGRLYGPGLAVGLNGRRARVYQGTWGQAPFQSLYQPAPRLWTGLVMMPEWYLVVAGLALLTLLGVSWPPLLLAVPLLGLAAAAPLLLATLSAAQAVFPTPAGTRWQAIGRRLLTAALYLLQPLPRLWGRLTVGLRPWRRRGLSGLSVPRRWTVAVWPEDWRSPPERIAAVESALRAGGAVVQRGGDFDGWDLELRGGFLGAVRAVMVVEEHGGGRQLVRLRAWPRTGWLTLVLIGLVALLAIVAAWGGAAVASLALATGALVLTGWLLWDWSAATATMRYAFAQSHGGGGE